MHQMKFVGVYQYCAIRIVMSIVAVIAQSQDVYCQLSNSPIFAHIWIHGSQLPIIVSRLIPPKALATDAVSSTVAMYCINQVYIQLKRDLERHRP